MSNRFTTLRETADDAEEEESVPRLDDDSEEPSLRAVRKQRLTCTNYSRVWFFFFFFYIYLQMLIKL